jgi:hypothetical protein
MLFVREFTVCKHERGLMFRNGDFVQFLAPSTYRFFDPLKRVEVERYDLAHPAFEHRLLDFLVRWYPAEIDALFVRVETAAHQIAVIYKNGHPWTVVAPERRALFWKGVHFIRAEVVDVADQIPVVPRIVQALAAELGADAGLRADAALGCAFTLHSAPEAHAGLLYVHEHLTIDLRPGVKI